VAIFYSFTPITMDGGAITWMPGALPGATIGRSGGEEIGGVLL
jgi:hypothetical protein